ALECLAGRTFLFVNVSQQNLRFLYFGDSDGAFVQQLQRGNRLLILLEVDGSPGVGQQCPVRVEAGGTDILQIEPGLHEITVLQRQFCQPMTGAVGQQGKLFAYTGILGDRFKVVDRQLQLIVFQLQDRQVEQQIGEIRILFRDGFKLVFSSAQMVTVMIQQGCQ